MSTTSRRTRNDRERDSQRESPAHLEEGSKGGVFFVDCESRHCCNSWEDVEEDAGGFGHAFTEPSRTGVFEVEFALGDGFGGDDVAGEVFLDGFCCADFEFVGVELAWGG